MNVGTTFDFSIPPCDDCPVTDEYYRAQCGWMFKAKDNCRRIEDTLRRNEGKEEK